jgi:hypothetical protein
MSVDLTGKIFGRLTCIRFIKKRDNQNTSRRFWICKCICGKEVEILISSLKSKNSQSCGCLKVDKATTHGLSKSSEFRIWSGMFQRCFNPKNDRFKDWGGRGIKVCDRWMKFENFLEDMGKRPSKKYSIDRINNDGDYEPSNCRWATRYEQQNNRRNRCVL